MCVTNGRYICISLYHIVNLKSVLPKFYQHVSCITKGESILDPVYTNIKHAYRDTRHPHLGQSDHLSAPYSCIQTSKKKHNSSDQDHDSSTTLLLHTLRDPCPTVCSHTTPAPSSFQPSSLLRLVENKCLPRATLQRQKEKAQ